MRMKKLVVIMGLVSVTVTSLFLHKTKSDSNIRNKDSADNCSTDNSADDNVSMIIDTSNIQNDDTEFENFKSSFISDISDRHEEASKIMNDAVKVIYKNSETSEDENRDLDEISNTLDELLGDE